jgi:RND family efflux transporter MFP subunit
MTRRTKNFVKVAPVEERDTPIPIHAIGRLGSDQEVKLSFKIGGIIASMRGDEGDYVGAGQLLASLRTNEIDAQVLKAERALQKNERDLERIQKMYADSAATLENVQDLTTLVQVSEADLDIAKFNQTYAQIKSPVSGRILRRLAEPNELVGPGQPLYLIAASGGGTYVMKVALSDRDINRVDYQSKAKVYFDAFPNQEFNARVTTIAESADPVTGTFEVELQVEAGKARLRNGFIGRVEILPSNSGPYLELPMSAIVEGDEQELSVFIPSFDSMAQMIKVEPFYITSEVVYVYKPKDLDLKQVITDGAPYLSDGDRIYIYTQ